MKELIQKAKVPIIIFSVLFLCFVAYNVFLKNDENTDAIVEYAVTDSAVRAELDKDILPLLTLVKNVKFDGAIFSDPTFQSLADFSKPIEPEEKGRPNPFAGTLVGPSDTVNQSSLLFTGGTADTNQSTGSSSGGGGQKPPGEF